MHLSKYFFVFSAAGFLLLQSGCSAVTSKSTFGATATCKVSSTPSLVQSPNVKNYGEYLVSASSQPTQSNHHLMGHVPASVLHSRRTRAMAQDQLLKFSISLQLTDEAKLDETLAHLYDPGHPDYHQFISQTEFKTRFHPGAQQIGQVSDFLKNCNIEVAQAEGAILKVSGLAGDVQNCFNTEIAYYEGQDGQEFYAPAYELQVKPAGARIKSVVGLTTPPQMRSHLVSVDDANPSVTAFVASSLVASNSPASIRKAYNIPASLDGTGRTLALVEFGGYTASDIQGYEDHYSLSHTSLRNILLDGMSGAPIVSNNNQVEVTLDIEMMVALAPRANKILVYEGSYDLDIFNRIAQDNLAESISTSWGYPENQGSTAQMQAMNTVFKQLAAQGQAVFAASGDSGAKADGSTIGTDYPASDPYVVAVGGSSLYTQADGTYDHETTWSGSGGGIDTASSFYKITSWQAAVVGQNPQASAAYRNVPDVSLNSNPGSGYAVYVTGSFHNYGGTSAAAPLWAAFLGLVNQQRNLNGLSNLGFPSPTLYGLALNSSYATNFHDIADNSSNGYYNAITGYDNTTGLGTFNGTNMVNALAAVPTPAPAVTTTPAMSASSLPGC
jgi:subtilase family serine protease